MPGPGGREVGRVSVRVLPDTSAFGRSLKRYLERVERTLRIEIPVDIDATQLNREVARAAKAAEKSARIRVPVAAETVRAEREIARVARDRKARVFVEVDRNSLSRATAAFGRLAVGGIPIRFDQIGRILTSWPGLFVLAGLVGLLTQTVGLLGLIPALGAVAGAGIGVLVAAFVGLKDSAVPAVKDMRKALKDIAPAWKRVQEAIRVKLFADVGDEIRQLARVYFPMLERALAGIGDSFNGMFKAFAAELRTPQTLRDTETGLANMKSAMDGLVRGIAPFVRAMRDITVVGSEFLRPFADAMSDASERFAEMVATARADGSLKAWIQTGIDAARTLFGILGSVTGIITGIGKAAINAGAVTGIATALKGISDAVNSAAGQRRITAFFTDVREALEKLGPAIEPIGRAFGAIAEALGPVLISAAEAFTRAMGVLAPVVEKIAPPLGKIAEFFLDTNIATGILVYAGAMKAAAVAQGLFLASNPLTAIVGLSIAWGLFNLHLYQTNETFKNTVDGMTRIFAGPFVRMFLTAKHHTGEFIRDTVVKFQGLPASMGAALRPLNGIITNAIIGALRNGAAAFVRWTAPVVAAAATLVRRIIAAFAGMWRAGVAIGKALIQGIMSGISQLTRDVLGKVASLAIRMKQAAERALGIGSPSKVFAEVGRNVAEGMAVGIDNGASRVHQAVARMAAFSVAGVGAPGGGGTVNQYLTVNNPAAERASNSIPVALRRAAYEMGY
jgi:hypothetical protein